MDNIVTDENVLLRFYNGLRANSNSHFSLVLRDEGEVLRVRIATTIHDIIVSAPNVELIGTYDQKASYQDLLDDIRFMLPEFGEH